MARGQYKSAANLFTEDRYTDAHREAHSRLLDSLHGQVLQAVAESRRIDAEAVDALANRAPLLRTTRWNPAWWTASDSATKPMPESVSSWAQWVVRLTQMRTRTRTLRRGCT